MSVEFRLLGDVEANVDGRLLELGHARQRCVLVALLVDANRAVPVDQLIDRVWSQHPPQRARGTLRSYVSRLRQVLPPGEVGIARRPGGYVLTVDPMAVDLYRFDCLIVEAGVTDRVDTALALLSQALGLWRGEPFATMDTPWLNGVRGGVERRWLAATLDRNDLALDLGQHAALLTDLIACAAGHPLDERLAGQLMLAMYRSGRQADALETYRQMRLRLAEELGTDPGRPLQQLHQQVLTADPAVAAATGAATAPARRSGRLPHQLPASSSSFTGRAVELAELDKLMGSPQDRGTMVVISAIGGIGGIGKTWLALRWANDNADRYPDGHLYVDLRGFDPANDPVAPAAAVRGFLDALGAEPAQVPVDPDAQAGLYRSLVAGRRMLIVLDNARDSATVTPLLPAAGPGAVLVTSRHQLAGLVATHDARPLPLDTLPDADARDLLTRRLGRQRTAAEPPAVTLIVRLCAGLPLALGIVAARAALQPHLPLADLAAQLQEAATRLDALDGGELAVNLRAVLAGSYRTLPPDAARLLGLLSLAAGPDLSLPAAASLAALGIGRTRVLLRDLAATHLVHEHRPDRYRMHDLVRLYAAEQMQVLDADRERRPALQRIFDHYLHTANAGALLLYPHRDPITLTPPAPGVTVEQLLDYERALSWFEAEHTVLIATVHQAFGAGFDTHAWQLAWTLATYLNRRGHWHDWVATQRVALAAAQRLTDQPGQAQAHRGLARAYTQFGRYDDAYLHARNAVDLFDALGDHLGQAHTHLDLARVLARQGRYRQALGHAERTLDLYRAAGNRARQATALNTVGWYHAELGDHQQALTYCQQALDLHQELGDRHGQAHTWDSLGYAHHHLGHVQQATACYHHALELIRQTSDRYYEAEMLNRLGDAHLADGEFDPARDAWQQALGILDGLGHADADQVRDRLRGLAHPGTGAREHRVEW
jgi:DNA-binding SARP family transcriptional activator